MMVLVTSSKTRRLSLMKIDFANLAKMHTEYANEIEPIIQKIARSGQFVMGGEVETLENELCAFIGSKYSITCSSGTSALLLTLLAIGVQNNDEIITTPFSFVSAAEVIALLGAKPVFADIDPLTFHINPNHIKSLITPKTKAIIPVSLFGQPCDMEAISTIAKKHCLALIEDAAQSFGAKYKNKKSANLSKLSITSFFPTKPLGCYGDGGAVFCEDKNLSEKIKSLRLHGQTKRYQHSYIGIGARLDTIQAAILRVKLKHYPDQISARQNVAVLYAKYLKNKPLALPYIAPDRESIYAQYSVLSSNRALLENALSQNRIPYTIHYPKPLHLQDCFKCLGYKKGDFPIAEDVAEKILSLPMNAYLSEKEIAFIAKTIPL